MAVTGLAASGSQVDLLKQQIESTRGQFTAAQDAQRQALAEQQKPNIRTTTGIKYGVTGSQERAQQAQQIQGLQAQAQSIAVAGQQFETQVAQQAPSYATPEAQQKELQRVQSAIQDHIADLQTSLQYFQQQLQGEHNKDARKSIREDIQRYQSRLDAYKAQVSGTPEDLILKYNTGYLSDVERAAADKAAAQIKYSDAKAKFEATLPKDSSFQQAYQKALTQGKDPAKAAEAAMKPFLTNVQDQTYQTYLKTTGDAAKAYEMTQNWLSGVASGYGFNYSPPTTPVVSYDASKLGQIISPNTYDVVSKTYTDASGNKQSMDIGSAQQRGASIIWGVKPTGQEKSIDYSKINEAKVTIKDIPQNIISSPTSQVRVSTNPLTPYIGAPVDVFGLGGGGGGGRAGGYWKGNIYVDEQGNEHAPLSMPTEKTPFEKIIPPTISFIKTLDVKPSEIGGYLAGAVKTTIGTVNVMEQKVGEARVPIFVAGPGASMSVKDSLGLIGGISQKVAEETPKVTNFIYDKTSNLFVPGVVTEGIKAGKFVADQTGKFLRAEGPGVIRAVIGTTQNIIKPVVSEVIKETPKVIDVIHDKTYDIFTPGIIKEGIKAGKFIVNKSPDIEITAGKILFAPEILTYKGLDWFGRNVVAPNVETAGKVLFAPEILEYKIAKWLGGNKVVQDVTKQTAENLYRLSGAKFLVNSQIALGGLGGLGPTDIVTPIIGPAIYNVGKNIPNIPDWTVNKVEQGLRAGQNVISKNIDNQWTLSMIADIERARLKEAPDKSSTRFFFEKLSQAEPINTFIVKPSIEAVKTTIGVANVATKKIGETKTPQEYTSDWLTSGTIKQQKEKERIFRTSLDVAGAGIGSTLGPWGTIVGSSFGEIVYPAAKATETARVIESQQEIEKRAVDLAFEKGISYEDAYKQIKGQSLGFGYTSPGYFSSKLVEGVAPVYLGITGGYWSGTSTFGSPDVPLTSEEGMKIRETGRSIFGIPIPGGGGTLPYDFKPKSNEGILTTLTNIPPFGLVKNIFTGANETQRQIESGKSFKDIQTAQKLSIVKSQEKLRDDVNRFDEVRKVYESKFNDYDKKQEEYKKKYLNKELNETEYNEGLLFKTDLDKQYNDLTIEKTKLDGFVKDYNSEINNLKTLGITAKEDSKGVTFTSDILGTQLGKANIAIMKTYLDPKTGKISWAGRGYEAERIVQQIAEGAAIGAITYGTGISKPISGFIGEAAKQGGPVVQKLLGGTGMKTLLALGLTAPTVSGGIKGYQAYSTAGLPPWEGAFTYGAGSAGYTGALLIGASGGKLSPLKYGQVKSPAEEEKTVIGIRPEKGGKTFSFENVLIPAKEEEVKAGGLYFENPLNPTGKAYPVYVSDSKGIHWFGYGGKTPIDWVPTLGSAPGIEPMTKFQSGYYAANIPGQTIRMGTEELTLEKGAKIMRQLYDVNINKVSDIDFDKSKAFQLLTPKQQTAFKNWIASQAEGQKGAKGFWNAITNKGLERLYGSSTIEAEGGFNFNTVRNGEYGDFDLAFRDLGQPKAEDLAKALGGKNIRLQKGTSLVEVKIPGAKGKDAWIHLADIHGSDTPELQLVESPWGLDIKTAKKFGIGGGKFIYGSQLSDSAVGKFGSVFEISKNPSGAIVFSPEGHRIKDVTDLPSIWQRLMQEAPGKVDPIELEQFKTLLKINYPEAAEALGGSTSPIFRATYPGFEAAVAKIISAGTPSAQTLINQIKVTPKLTAQEFIDKIKISEVTTKGIPGINRVLTGKEVSTTTKNNAQALIDSIKSSPKLSAQSLIDSLSGTTTNKLTGKAISGTSGGVSSSLLIPDMSELPQEDFMFSPILFSEKTSGRSSGSFDTISTNVSTTSSKGLESMSLYQSESPKPFSVSPKSPGSESISTGGGSPSPSSISPSPVSPSPVSPSPSTPSPSPISPYPSPSPFSPSPSVSPPSPSPFSPSLISPSPSPPSPSPSAPEKSPFIFGFPFITFPEETQKGKRKKKKKQPTGGFSVEVKRRTGKRKGKFVPVSTRFGLSRPEAEALAMRELLKGPEATARLIPSAKPIRPSGIKISSQVRGYFRPGRKAGEIVQKERFRIITPAEKAGITIRGAAAKRARPKGKPYRRYGKKSTKSLNKSLSGVRRIRRI